MDLISKHAVLELAYDIVIGDYRHRCIDAQAVEELPTYTMTTLYGYPVRYLALIANVLERDGVSVEKSAEILSDCDAITEYVIRHLKEEMEKDFNEQIKRMLR